MNVNGAPIDEYQYREAIVSIRYRDVYELEQARIYAGIGIAEFDALPGTPQWAIDGERTKTHILVLFRMSNAVPAVVSDAQARDMQRKASRKGGR